MLGVTGMGVKQPLALGTPIIWGKGLLVSFLWSDKTATSRGKSSVQGEGADTGREKETP